MTRHFAAVLGMLGVVCISPALPLASRAGERIVEFNRDIRPILSDTCYHCHGPDKAKRKARLRLDTEAGAFADLGDYQAIVPGKPTESEVYRRIIASEPSERMPPIKSGRSLTRDQIDLLRRWIQQGAKWQKHWAFMPPTPPPLPAINNTAWPRSPIDHFALARMEKERLSPNPEADRVTLLRRLTFDLTGLPPTPAEVDSFLADRSPDAYNKVVDRLLGSPRYGERLAGRWLDAARYADTNGYQTDGERTMWRWRDWVIDAYNRNLPFDQFTIEQLAGDLLPQATLDQRIATGFNRNHRGNSEGGIVPEEFAVEYVVDRVETTCTVWLGLTMGCARCHDHKYDPFSQKEFYQLFAYFNNVPEHGRAVKTGNSPPYIKSPTPEQQRELQELDKQLASSESTLRNMGPAINAAQRAWEKTISAASTENWAPSYHLVAHYPLDGNGTKGLQQVGSSTSLIRGPVGKAVDLDGRSFLQVPSAGNFGYFDRFSLGAWILPRKRDGAILSRMAEEPRSTGYSLTLHGGRVQVHMTARWLDDAMRMETIRSLPLGQWHHVFVTYDGSRAASGIRVYVDGKIEATRVLLDELNQTFKTTEPFRIGSGGGPGSRFEGAINDVRVYDECLTHEEAAALAAPEPLGTLVAIPPDRRTAEQVVKLRSCFLRKYAPESMRHANQLVLEQRRRRERLVEGFPTTMVMMEMATPRPTHILVRGNYDNPGKNVEPGLPSTLAQKLPAGKNNRLLLARWLVAPTNPLTARVIVNRFWQMYFGTGLIKTVDDFGSQGEPPSHPELLDWLAGEFVRLKWDMKALQRLIVTSATYRQSSKVSPELAQRDPDNRLLARGARYRFPAEMIRDQALAASGLLVERLGGPSVKPYQPAGLWSELTGGDEYKQDKGENLYRRSLYTYWKRTVAPPAMMNFDASGREFCFVRETRTNTPLQALNLMNDITFVEASRVLAQRVMIEAGKGSDDRLRLAFRLVLARKPTEGELTIMRTGWQTHLASYRQAPDAAVKLVSVGEFPRNRNLDACELAAYTAVVAMLFNLDEAITKE